MGGPLLGACWNPARGLKVETLFWRCCEEGEGPDWAVVFDVDDVVKEVEVEREEGAVDEGSEFVCGAIEGEEEEGFWKSLWMSTLVGFGVGVDEGAGASSLGVDESDLDNEGATSLVAVGEKIVGGGGFEVELDCEYFRDDETGCWFPKEGVSLPPPFTAGTDPNDLTPSVLIGGTLAGDEDIVAELSSIDPKVTESRGERGISQPVKRRHCRTGYPCSPIHGQACKGPGPPVGQNMG